MNKLKKALIGTLAVCIATVNPSIDSAFNTAVSVNAAENISASMEWGTVKIGGGGFVSGIVTGKKVMYARTDVGGAYKYDYSKKEWVQLMEFVNEQDRGFLSVDAICIDPNNDDNVYMLCGCAYFSSERTVIFKTTDGGETWKEIDITDLIKVHGNGYGRQCGEAIAVDPDNSDIIYCGGDTDGLIMSKDAGETWEYVDSFNELGLFTNEIKWPTWSDTIEKTTEGADYVNCNGIATIAIENGKVYVGISDTTIGANVYVADVGKDNWKPLSSDLPTNAFPSRINKDSEGNLLICYVGGLTFNGTGGGIYRYNIKDSSVTEISPTENSFGACVSMPDNPDELIATTCGVWSGQMYDKDDWANELVCYGDWIYRSFDGGETWESLVPGQAKYWEGPLEADYIQTSGYDWIKNKAIHWCGALVLDPCDSERMLVTSGNGVFASDNIWSELPQYYFHPDGIEEVVALDMISVPGGDEFSAIGDYDGFRHTTVHESGQQHKPNMGSTAAIAYCPSDTDVMVRYAENANKSYYTTDGGKTWQAMASPKTGGKAAITKLKDGTYRFFHSSTMGQAEYSDDYGSTWTSISTISNVSSTIYFCVDLKNPAYVYAYSYNYNSYDPNTPKEYKLFVSDDYGANFTAQNVATYDQCDSAARIAYLDEGKIALAAGWYGLYIASDYGKNIEKTDVFYCKTVGYGAPEKDGGINTLYMYGKPAETDPEGVYRSTDGGKNWICINTDKLYGGTGNGNFLIGDMNEFGTVYMSTVGCGIVYGKIASDIPPTTEDDSKTTTTVTTTTVADKTETLYGDSNDNGTVEIADAVYILQSIADPSNKEYVRTAKGELNADCCKPGNGVDAEDALAIQQFVAEILKSLPVK